MLFQEYFKGDLIKFQDPFKQEGGGCQECSKGAYWKFQGCFQSVSKVLQVSLKKMFKVFKRHWMLHGTRGSYLSNRRVRSGYT